MEEKLKQKLKKDFHYIVKGSKLLEPICKDLKECYNSYNEKKEKTFKIAKELEKKYNGLNGGIVDFNTSYFTYIFTFIIDGKIYQGYIRQCNTKSIVKVAIEL